MSIPSLIYDALQSWLVVEKAYGVTVIPRRDNRPAPGAHYMIIDQTAGIRNIGTPDRNTLSPTDVQSRIHDWECDVALWEIGACDILPQVKTDIDDQDAIDYMESKGVIVQADEDIIPMPDLVDDQYREQFRMQLRVAIRTNNADTSISPIESLEISTPGLDDATLAHTVFVKST